MTEAALQEVERIKTLSVVGLRQELDKHGLEKSGLKADLIKRLEKCILEGSTSPKDNDASTADGNDDTEIPTIASESPTPEVDVNESSVLSKKITAEDDTLSVQSENLPAENTKSPQNVTDNDTDSGDVPVSGKDIDSVKESSSEIDLPDDDEVCAVVSSKEDATGENDESVTPNVISLEEETEPISDDEIPGIETEKDASGENDESVSTATPNVISLEEETEPISDDEIPGIETETDPISDEDLPGSETETDPISDEELPDDDVEKDAGAQDKIQEEEDKTTNDDGEQCEFVDVADTPEESMETESADTAEKTSAESDTPINNGTTDDTAESSDDEVKEIEPPPKPIAPLVVIEDDDTNDELPNDKDKNDSTSKSKSSVKKEKETKKSNDAKKKNDRKTSSSSKTSRSQKSSSKDKRVDNKRKETKEDKNNDLSRSLWISKLSSITKAVDLKELFAQHGKVVGAKVVTSAKLPGSQCFGYVTMSTAEEAAACIAKFDKTVLHEQTIDVEKAKTDPTPGAKKTSSKSEDHKTDEKNRHRSSSKNSSSSRSRHDDKNRSHEKKSDEEKKKKNKTSAVTSPTDEASKDLGSTSKDKASKDSSKEKVAKDTSKEKSSKESSKEKTSKDTTKSSKASDSSSSNKDDGKGAVVVIDDQKTDTQSKKDSAKKTGNKSGAISKERLAAEKELREKEAKEKARRERIEAERKAREERRRREKEEEEKEREERRKYLEKREKERREWERKESERLRAERERQREEEKAREHERNLREKMAKERYLREKREREERAREEERERLEQERIEREAFLRAHQDRLRRDKEREEREERELAERERQRKEKMEQEELQFRMEKERIQDEISRLEKKCAETERHAVMVDRGLGIKRSSGDDRRDSHPDAKRMLHDSPEKDYYGPPIGRNDSKQTFDRAHGNFRGQDQPNIADSRDSLRNAVNRREDDIVHNPNQERFPKASDIRRVIPNDGPVRTYNRDRSPQRADSGSKYPETSRSHNNAPKTLSDVLGRAGLSGILGTRAEEKSTYSSSTARTDDRYYGNNQNAQDAPSRVIDRSQDNAASDFRKPQRDTRVNSNETRDVHMNDSFQRNERRLDERRQDRRLEERRNDEPRVDERRNDEPHSARRELSKVNDGYSRGEREPDFKANADSTRNDRHDNRNDNRNDIRNDNRNDNRASQNQRPVNNTNISNDRNFNTNALHPALARDIGGILPIAGQPRVLPFTDIFGRPLQILPNAQAINAGYAAAAVQAQVQNIGLQSLGRSPAASIQLNRNGQLELARMNTTPQTNVGVQGGGRRF